MLRWGFPSGVSPFYHFFVENHFERLPLNPQRQLEFRIPGGKADMFDSLTGEVFEIEPVGNEDEGAGQVRRYVAELAAAGERKQLTPVWFGIARFHWNDIRWKPGGNAPPGWGTQKI